MNARKGRTSTLTLSTLGALWVAASSCSVLYDFNTSQCNTDLDCESKGSQFHNSICQNNVCVAKASLPTGGAASTGGQSALDTGGDVSTTGGTLSIGGESSLGGTSTIGGESATGGTSTVTSTAPACVNTECMKANEALGTYTCINDKCVPLTTAQCDQVLPQAATDPAYNYQKLLEAPHPIIIGGFANMSGLSNHHDTQAIVNWDLALSEFNQQTHGGVPSADGTATQRPIIGVICNGVPTSADDITTAMAHLAGNLHVPGILTTLSSDYLISAFGYTNGQGTSGQAYLNSGGTPVFFMSSSSASMALTTLDDKGMVWHVLGNPRLLAATMVSWIKKIEPIVNQARQAYATANPGGPDDPTQANSLKVLIVYNNNNTTMQDLENILIGGDISAAGLAFDSATAGALLLNGNLRTVAIPSGSIDPTPVTDEIKANPPHIIIALESTEFPKTVLPYIENETWKSLSTRMRPYYVLPQNMYNSTDLTTTVKGLSFQVDKRIMGVNYAQIQDATSTGLYASYLDRLKASYQSYAGTTGKLTLPGTENMYDAAYYLLYSVAAAAVKQPTFTGVNILNAFEQKVINLGASTVGVGPSSIIQTISAMYTATYPPFAMKLWGCDGSPDFDLATGTRLSPTSVWCMQYDTTQSAWVYQADGFLYDATTKTFVAPTSGVPACLQNYN